MNIVSAVLHGIFLHNYHHQYCSICILSSILYQSSCSASFYITIIINIALYIIITIVSVVLLGIILHNYHHQYCSICILSSILSQSSCSASFYITIIINIALYIIIIIVLAAIMHQLCSSIDMYLSTWVLAVLHSPSSRDTYLILPLFLLFELLATLVSYPLILSFRLISS